MLYDAESSSVGRAGEDDGKSGTRRSAFAGSGGVTNTNEFVGQVQELSEKLDIELPIEQIEPQQPKAIEP